MGQTPYLTSRGDGFTAIFAALAFPVNRRTACLANAQRHLIMSLAEAGLEVRPANLERIA